MGAGVAKFRPDERKMCFYSLNKDEEAKVQLPFPLQKLDVAHSMVLSTAPW